MASNPSMEGLVEEPISGQCVPLSLQMKDGTEYKVLMVTGLRVKKIMVDIQVYVLAIYARVEDLSDVLADHPDAPGQSPKPEVLLERLLACQAEKSFRMSFLRTLTRKQVLDGLSEGLKGVGVPQQDVDLLAPHIPASIQKGDVLTFTASPGSGEVMIGDTTLASPALCTGLHQAFLGPKATLQGLRDSIQRQWQVWHKRRVTSGDGGASDSGSGTDEASFEPQKSLQSSQPPATGSSTDVGAAGSSLKMSWKERAGRSNGKDGYKFGDITRGLVRKPDVTAGRTAVVAWPGPLVIEDEGNTWIAVKDVVPIDNVALQQQRIDGRFYKFHGSRARGVLLRQWTQRYYELVSGAIRYRRQSWSPPSKDVCIAGCHIRVEPSKDLEQKTLCVFSIWRGNSMVCRLATEDRSLALRWILALAGTCAHFHNLENGGGPSEGSPKVETVAEFLEDVDVASSAAALDEKKEKEAEPIADALEVSPASRQKMTTWCFVLLVPILLSLVMYHAF